MHEKKKKYLLVESSIRFFLELHCEKIKEVFVFSMECYDMRTFMKNNEINRKLVWDKYEKKRKKMKGSALLYLRRKRNTYTANEVMW